MQMSDPLAALQADLECLCYSAYEQSVSSTKHPYNAAPNLTAAASRGLASKETKTRLWSTQHYLHVHHVACIPY